jgi:EAL domain-containing protein (putative c-di-GMP-specific phosphodiesterase class I)
VIRDPEAIEQKLKHLHEIGFRLSMDDFGTGYSSLSHLRRFRFDRIKIDRSFVGDEEASDIVTAVVALARGLKLKVIAEGVETAAQLNRLREQHCDEAQGFLFGPAVSASEFERLVTEWDLSFDPHKPVASQKNADTILSQASRRAR